MTQTPQIFSFDVERANGEPITDYNEIGSLLSDIFTSGGPNFVLNQEWGEDFPEGENPEDYLGQYWVSALKIAEWRTTLRRVGGLMVDPDTRASVQIYL